VLPIKGQSIRKMGLKERVSWLWQFSKRCYIEKAGRSRKGRAINAPTEGDESLGGKKSLFGLGSFYSFANLQLS